MGDQYVAARSNEFGYANYEMMPKAPVNLLDLGRTSTCRRKRSTARCEMATRSAPPRAVPLRPAPPGRVVEAARPPGPPRRSRFTRLLREPLVHFLLLGLLLFAGWPVLARDATRTPSSNQIELTLDDLRQLEIAFTSQWQRPPTPEEMVGLVESKVREEVLYREALALGLDKNDTIVKRRMAQKMEFLAEDVSGAREPTADELRSVVRAERGPRFADARAASRSVISTSRPTGGASAPATSRSRRSQNLGEPSDSPGGLTRATRSCSRTTMPIARPSSSPRSSARASPRRCLHAHARFAGRGRSSPATAGI